MKRTFKFMALVMGLMLVSVAAFCQVDSVTVVAPVPAEYANGIFTDFASFFATFGSMIPLVVFIASWINGKLKFENFTKQFIAWLVSLALSFLGWVLHLGFLDGLIWSQVLIYGFAGGLAANGFFDIVIIQALLKAIGLEKQPAPVKPE